MSNDVPVTVPGEGAGGSSRSVGQLYETATDWHRRYTLSLLEDAGGPVSEEDLATAIAADEHDKPERLVTDEERDAVLARLRHVHLPKLADADLIEQDGDIVVATGDRSFGEDGRLADLIDAGDGLDQLYDVLSDALRRDLVAALAERRDAVLSLEEAADAVADRPAMTDGGTVQPGDRVLVSLHHHHLPKLDDAGIVSYDADERRVVYEGHPALSEERL